MGTAVMSEIPDQNFPSVDEAVVRGLPMPTRPISKKECASWTCLDRHPTRVTDETLFFARRNPTKMAAWVLREIIDELIDWRLTDRGYETQEVTRDDIERSLDAVHRRMTGKSFDA